MASESNHSESVPIGKLYEVADENYRKLSDEFARSQQQYIQAISGLQQEYLESIKFGMSLYQIKYNQVLVPNISRSLNTW